MNHQSTQYINPDQRKSLQEQRMQRFAQMGIRPTEGVSLNAGDVNGTFHNPEINRRFGDILSGSKRNVYKEMFGGTSSPGSKPKVDSQFKVDKSKDAELSNIERMFDPDRGSTMQMRSSGQFSEISAEAIGPDFNIELQRRLAQKARVSEEQVLNQGTYHDRLQGYPTGSANAETQAAGLSYSQFALNKEAFAPQIPSYAQATSEQRENYAANQSYMYQMNEGMIRDIAQNIAEETIKSVLREYIKAERDKYAFERVLFNKDGKKIELLKQGETYYKLKTVKTSQGNFTALEEVSVRRKRRK